MDEELDKLLKIDPEINKSGSEKILFADKIKADYLAGLDSDNEPLLHKCGKRNDIRTAEWLTAQGYPIDQRNSNGENVLHVTCINNNKIAFISWVLSFSKGAMLNTRDGRGYTPLLIAIKRGQVYVVKCLLLQGADLAMQSNGGANALHICCCVGESIAFELLNLIIEHLNNLNKNSPEPSPFNTDKTLIATLNVPDNTGKTPLFLAVSLKKDRVVKKLLQHGVTPNTTDKDGNTLFHAIAKGEANYPIKELVTVDTKINVTNNQGQTPLHLYLESGNSWVKDIVFLLENGADVTICDNQEQNALHKAAKQTSLKYMVLFDMLKKGGDAIYKQDINGQTPLHLAIKNCSAAMPYLLKYDFDLSVEDKNGDTALDIAFQQDSLCYKLLEIPDSVKTSRQFRSSYPIDLQNKQGNTLLHHACDMSNKHVVKALLDRGAQLNIKNKLGLQPLETFVARKFLYKTKWVQCEVEMLSCMAKFGADFNTIGHNNRSLIHDMLCHMQGPEGYNFYLLQALLILIESKIDINLKDQNSFTPLQRTMKYISECPLQNINVRFKMQNVHDGIAIMISAGADVLKLHSRSVSTKFCTLFEKYFLSQDDHSIVELLLKFGYSFSKESIEYYIEDEHRMSIDCVPSLKCLASCKIRCSLKPNAWVSVDALDLPKRLKEYVVLFRKHFTDKYGLNSKPPDHGQN